MKPLRITAVRKKADGDIAQFQLEDGSILEYYQCIDFINAGWIEGAHLGKTIHGEDMIVSNRDDDVSNNLVNLPEF